MQKQRSIVNRLKLVICLLLITQSSVFFLLWQGDSLSIASFIYFTLFFILSTLAAFRWVLMPLTEALKALNNGISSLRDKDYSLTVYNKDYREVSGLINIYNELSSVLRQERMDIFQRELLLDTVIQSTPVSLVLTNQNGAVVYSNLAAKKLFKQTQSLNGLNINALINNLTPALQAATINKENGLITEHIEQEKVITSVNCRQFSLNGREHHLYLFKNMTAEISHQEIDLWKQVIRLISHELNNSLAPIASLTSSAKKIIQQPEHLHMLEDVLETIGNRTQHLHNFIHQYAKFAKLPKPEPQEVHLSTFVEQLRHLTDVNITSDFLSDNAFFDPSLIEQVLINLVKNALESGSEKEAVGLDIRQHGNQFVFSVFDRGTGLSEAKMQQALLPFYTTKKTGSGIGLALCNDIVSQHNGKLTLTNRDHGGLCVSFSLPIKVN